MTSTSLHSRVLGQAFEKVLGRSDSGTMAFVRCLAPDVVEHLAKDLEFALEGWTIRRVADSDDESQRTITADQAVEVRESKSGAIVLLVDTSRAGAGMDGIYSAAREIDEAGLFREALRLAARQITDQQGRQAREFAERAVKKARGFGQLYSISPWQEFDYYVRVAAEQCHPGELLWLLGLWPVRPEEDERFDTGALDISRLFVDRLLGAAASGQTPSQRIEALRLLNPREEQRVDLERFLHSAATRPLLTSLENLVGCRHLWVNELKLEGAAHVIQAIELVPWRTRQGKLAKWSGLIQEAQDEPPVLILDPKADANGNYAKLELRWKSRPDNLEKNAVQYQVTIVTDMNEELASRDVPHSAKKEEKCRFTKDDFAGLSDDALINAKIVVSVIGDDSVATQESDEFVIRFGTPPDKPTGGAGKVMRTFSEGLIELDDRDMVTAMASATDSFPLDSKGYVVLRTPQRGKSFRVFRPPLVHEVEQDWVSRNGEIGRWKVKVRASGARAGVPEFVPIAPIETSEGTSSQSPWERAANASRRMAEKFGTCGGGVGQVYDQNAKAFDTVVKEYVLAWSILLDDGDPHLALANTVEIQSLSGRTIGLVVLPAHPLRVAWHAAYDNLVLHSRYEQGAAPKQVREELSLLDGAMFPAFLPGLESGRTFVFADTLGFHTVGMVADDDREPKAAIAILARALGDSESADTAPTVGRQSAQVLGNEILKYIECHDTSKLLRIHALRPGDGLTVARSLGHVQKRSRRAAAADESEEDSEPTAPSFVLELYPSAGQRGVAGRFIAEAREKRRSGAGVVLEDDQWMLESTGLRGGVAVPRLRWARKRESDPKSAAHLAVAFDTFESRVVPTDQAGPDRPFFAFGLMSFFERDYSSLPSPLWRSTVAGSTVGEKHPGDRMHTERLIKLQQAIHGCVIRSSKVENGVPALRTEISPEKAYGLRELHRLCDWVITLDRNAGIEYFDSPRDNRDVYDAYVIDCVPEREDLGCLQLITSTSNLEEVRNLLDGALDRMSLSRSRRNAEFLLSHLKALSGRLAIRLTGQKAPTVELIALAMCHANCLRASDDDDCWTSLRTGFFVPVDDIRDLLPPVADRADATILADANDDGAAEQKATRPDLIHVSLVPRKGLRFRFAEVKYRRHLRTARSPDALQSIRQQVASLRRRWEEWYGTEEVCLSFRAVRRAKLARVLRFYADKSRRHADDDEKTGLSADAHEALIWEIDRLIEKGGDYAFASLEAPDRGWVFCPEYVGTRPLEITPIGWDTRIFMFGADSSFRRDSGQTGNEPRPSLAKETRTAEPARRAEEDGLNAGSTERVAESDSPPVDATAVTPAPDHDSGPVMKCESDPTTSPDAAPSVRLGTNLHSGAEVHWPLTVRGNPHLLVAGLPGMGKTTCLLNICRQMLEFGIRPIVFSYHQDIDEKLQQMVGSVRFIDFDGLGFNPLQVINRSPRMAHLDVAGAVRDIFVTIFPELGDIQGERIRRAIKDSFVELGWGDPASEPAQLAEPEFSRWVEILRSEPKPDRGLRTLLARLEELEDYGFFRTAESQQSLWDSDRSVVVRIHSTQNDYLQKAFASLVFYSLYKDMFRRGLQDYITHALIFDEAHRAARLQLIPTMAKECRKYGISLVLASQEARDFHISLYSAIANYLVLRLTEADARAMAKNVATSDQERILIDRIKQMDRFRAFYCSEGQRKPAPVALLE
ncbi:MAG: ATP-binding protein [Thermoguttaceae bacterium]|jgi:DNA phosphorothioation-dependent restriction protein DptH